MGRLSRTTTGLMIFALLIFTSFNRLFWSRIRFLELVNNNTYHTLKWLEYSFRFVFSFTDRNQLILRNNVLVDLFMIIMLVKVIEPCINLIEVHKDSWVDLDPLRTGWSWSCSLNHVKLWRGTTCLVLFFPPLYRSLYCYGYCHSIDIWEYLHLNSIWDRWPFK